MSSLLAFLVLMFLYRRINSFLFTISTLTVLFLALVFVLVLVLVLLLTGRLVHRLFITTTACIENYETTV